MALDTRKASVFIAVVVTCLQLVLVSADDDETTMVISMPPIQPKQKDEYICFAQKLDVDGAYFQKVETRANRRFVHHAGIGFCDGLISTEPVWTCTNMTGKMCTGAAVTAGGWDDLTKDNGVFELPKDVGFKVGRQSPLKYVIFEVHFRGPIEGPVESAANVTLVLKQTPPKYHYQMYLLSNVGFIPANRPHGFFSDVACPWKGPSVFAHSYIVHTHFHGVLVEGFLIRDQRWIVIGSHLSVGKTRRRYAIPGGRMEIKDGDILAARCLYINDNDHDVVFGHGIDDEMCNFMIDFAYDPVDDSRFDKIVSCNEKTPEFSFCKHPETAAIC